MTIHAIRLIVAQYLVLLSVKVVFFSIIIRSILIVLFLQNLFSPTPATDASSPVESEPVELAGFQLISTYDGWLWLGQHLYWTKDSGQSWIEITPPNLGQSTIRAAWFMDTQSGWLALTQLEVTGAVIFSLARTTDGGDTWQFAPLHLFEPYHSTAPPEAIYLYFLDAQTGWLVVKQATSNNFSLGTLFKTSDGGQSWTELALPIGEPVYFATSELGWVAGGPADNQLYHTQDGGLSWQAQPVGRSTLRPGEQSLYQLPTFEDGQRGVLPVMVNLGDKSRVDFYQTSNGGVSWKFATSVSLGQDVIAGTVIQIDVVDSTHWVIRVHNRNQLLGLSGSNGAIALLGQGDWVEGIVELDLITPNVGWARYSMGNCATEPGQSDQIMLHCLQETRLLHTSDGGQTWTPLKLPGTDKSEASRDQIRVESVTLFGEKPADHSVAGQALADLTGVFIGQGFDKCEIASPSQLQTWQTASPYRVVNLYIGGSNRYCTNKTLSAALLVHLNRQGWRFVPTWVGPQAACTNYAFKMSYDLTTAYNQGLAEANAALNVAHNLGLTLEDRSGTIIYYDLEYYDTTNLACRDAARAFMAGWTGQLRAWGNKAGVYSTGAAFSGFATIPNVPDAIWPAHWIYSAYNPNATVWNVYSLSNSLWNNQQRIRQYTGGHNETWGGLTLNIDSDVIEGVVASLHHERVYLPLILVTSEVPVPTE